MSAARFAVGGVAAATTITALGQMADGKTPRLRVFIAGAGAAIVLGAIAGALPALARMFAVLLVLGALLGPGYSLINAARRLID